MRIVALEGAPDAGLARALEAFESQFVYPLGPGRSFRISHGEDYPRFFRAMGEARSFVVLRGAEGGCEVTGVLGVALRSLVAPGGETLRAAYTGDLKVDPGLRGSMVFFRLAQAGLAWARPRATAGWAVVMEGTRTSPKEHTGRVGIPGFGAVRRLLVLQLPTVGAESVKSWEGGDEALFRELSAGRYHALSARAELRSEMQPVWLAHPEGLACGRVEDTRRAKRLIGDDGAEIMSAHLSQFAWRTPEAGAALIHAARGVAGRAGYPSIFVAVDEGDLEAIGRALGAVDRAVAPATIYGAGDIGSAPWNINTAEI